MSEKIALISDLHSNIEALEAVLKDIQDQKIETIVCLGDLIGYGPNPREVLRHTSNWKWTLRGNHEDALLFLALDFNPDAARVIEWTRDAINDDSKDKEENHKLWNFLGALPDIRQEDSTLFVHASPRHHTKEYVRPHDIADKLKMEEIFSMIEHVCFCGHTHEPGVFTQDLKFYPPRTFANRVKLSDGRKYYVNIGSVGQPRDRDTRSCYVVWDGTVVEFRRVEYNYQQTMQKIFDIGTIPKRFGERLQHGR
jgi:predicted phosphodiesterase